MAVATLTSKGQLTVPLGVRQSLGLQAGDKVDFVPDASAAGSGCVVEQREAVAHALVRLGDVPGDLADALIPGAAEAAGCGNSRDIQPQTHSYQG